MKKTIFDLWEVAILLAVVVFTGRVSHLSMREKLLKNTLSSYPHILKHAERAFSKLIGHKICFYPFKK